MCCPVPLCRGYDTLYSTADFSLPETFQTFSFGANVYETSAVRFAEKKNGIDFQCGDEIDVSPGFRHKYGH